MGCLKLHTEKNHITLKVVHRAVNTSVLEKQEEKNKSAFLQVAYRNFKGGGQRRNLLSDNQIAQDIIGGANIAVQLTNQAQKLAEFAHKGLTSGLKFANKGVLAPLGLLTAGQDFMAGKTSIHRTITRGVIVGLSVIPPTALIGFGLGLSEMAYGDELGDSYIKYGMTPIELAIYYRLNK